MITRNLSKETDIVNGKVGGVLEIVGHGVFVTLNGDPKIPVPCLTMPDGIYAPLSREHATTIAPAYLFISRRERVRIRMRVRCHEPHEKLKHVFDWISGAKKCSGHTIRGLRDTSDLISLCFPPPPPPPQKKKTCVCHMVCVLVFMWT